MDPLFSPALAEAGLDDLRAPVQLYNVVIFRNDLFPVSQIHTWLPGFQESRARLLFSVRTRPAVLVSRGVSCGSRARRSSLPLPAPRAAVFWLPPPSLIRVTARRSLDGPVIIISIYLLVSLGGKCPFGSFISLSASSREQHEQERSRPDMTGNETTEKRASCKGREKR